MTKILGEELISRVDRSATKIAGALDEENSPKRLRIIDRSFIGSYIKRILGGVNGVRLYDLFDAESHLYGNALPHKLVDTETAFPVEFLAESERFRIRLAGAYSMGDPYKAVSFMWGKEPPNLIMPSSRAQRRMDEERSLQALENLIGAVDETIGLAKVLTVEGLSVDRISEDYSKIYESLLEARKVCMDKTHRTNVNHGDNDVLILAPVIYLGGQGHEVQLVTGDRDLRDMVEEMRKMKVKGEINYDLPRDFSVWTHYRSKGRTRLVRNSFYEDYAASNSIAAIPAA